MQATERRERPIIFSGEMVRAILDGRKTMTRRVMKPQPDLIYRLLDDRIQAVHTGTTEWSDCYERYQVNDWCYSQVHPYFSERGLQSWIGRANLLTDEICRVWEEGARGLVCASRSQKQQGVFDCVVVPSKQEGYEVSPSPDLHGVSRNAKGEVSASAAPGRNQGQQRPGKSMLGHAGGELAGSEGARTGTGRRKTPDVQAERCGARTSQMGFQDWTLQPKTRRTNVGNELIIHVLNSPFRIGQMLWVREAWASTASLDSVKPSNLLAGFPCQFRAGGTSVRGRNELVAPGRWRPSIHMPRWASRIMLEVTDVQVARVQSISHEDAKSEGVHEYNGGVVDLRSDSMSLHQHQFANLWDSLTAKRGYSWDSNPWVWIVEFKQAEETA